MPNFASFLLLALLAVGLVLALAAGYRSYRRKPEMRKDAVLPHTADSTVLRDPRLDETLMPRIVRHRTLPSLSSLNQSPTPPDPQTSYFEAAESNLARAFDQFERGRTSLESFERTVGIEADVVKRAQLRLQADELRGDILGEAAERLREDLESAQIAIQWCRDWAEDMRPAAGFGETSSEPGSDRQP